MKTNTLQRNSQLMIVLICLLIGFNASAQKLRRALTESWQGAGWNNYSQTTNLFDGKGVQMNALLETWNGNGEWQRNMQTVETNNIDGTLSASVTQMWNPYTNDWENTQRTAFTYNNVAQVTSELNQVWKSGNWMNSTIQTNVFDTSGNRISETYQTWNPKAKAWVKDKFSMYNYNTNGTVNSVTSQLWNPVSKGWENYQHTAYTYNASDKVLTETRQNWIPGAWQNSEMDTNVYDTNGYLTNASTQVWLPETAAWENDARYAYTNNIDGTIAQSITQSWENGAWNNELRFTFSYEGLSAADLSVTGFSVSPNPARDVINVESDVLTAGVSYNIADQMGRSYLAGTLNDGQTAIDVNALATGVYYIYIGPEMQHSIKLVKE